MSAVLFIRHGQTDMAGRFCGHADPGLNAVGQAQAVALAEALASEPIERIYASDLSRARETAETLARGRTLAIEQRDALREIGFGQWEGRRWEEIEALDPEYATRWLSRFPHLPAPHGEPLAAFTARVLKGVKTILDESRGLTAVVTHAGVLRIVLTHFLDRSNEEAWAQTQPYCSIIRYQPSGEKQ
jgi:alpha-ribazole phosphatase